MSLYPWRKEAKTKRIAKKNQEAKKSKNNNNE